MSGYGWLTESTIVPEKRKVLETGDRTGILDKLRERLAESRQQREQQRAEWKKEQIAKKKRSDDSPSHSDESPSEPGIDSRYDASLMRDTQSFLRKKDTGKKGDRATGSHSGSQQSVASQKIFEKPTEEVDTETLREIQKEEAKKEADRQFSLKRKQLLYEKAEQGRLEDPENRYALDLDAKRRKTPPQMCQTMVKPVTQPVTGSTAALVPKFGRNPVTKPPPKAGGALSKFKKKS